MADEKKNTDAEKWQAEWLELVHNGACCADIDPQKEEKKAFLESIAKQKEASLDSNNQD